MKNVSLRLLAFVVAVPALASCDPSLNLIQVAPGCPDMPLRGPADYLPASPEAVIDDFDDGDLWLNKAEGRTGSWVGVATPGAATGLLTEWSDECIAHGTYSGHLAATTITTYGANWNAVFIDPFALARPFDAHNYSGFSFWVAAGKNAALPLELPIGLMTIDTSGPGGVCSQCGDYYRVKDNIPLTHTWTRWVVTFKELGQIGVGSPQVPLNVNELVSLMIWPEKTSDIWIDDVRFEP
jgi:hypothetical protein